MSTTRTRSRKAAQSTSGSNVATVDVSPVVLLPTDPEAWLSVLDSGSIPELPDGSELTPDARASLGSALQLSRDVLRDAGVRHTERSATALYLALHGVTDAARAAEIRAQWQADTGLSKGRASQLELAARVRFEVPALVGDGKLTFSDVDKAVGKASGDIRATLKKSFTTAKQRETAVAKAVRAGIKADKDRRNNAGGKAQTPPELPQDGTQDADAFTPGDLLKNLRGALEAARAHAGDISMTEHRKLFASIRLYANAVVAAYPDEHPESLGTVPTVGKAASK